MRLSMLGACVLLGACGSASVSFSDGGRVDAGVARDAGVDAGAGGGRAGGGMGGGSSTGGGRAGGTGGGLAVAGGMAAGGMTAGGSTGGGDAGGDPGGGEAGGGTAGGSGGGSAGGSATGGGFSGADAGVIALNGADTCDAAPDVSAGGLFSGSTFSATDDYSISGANCPTGGAASGRDVAYAFTPPTTRTYRVVVTPIDRVLPDGGLVRFNPMLYVQSMCGVPGCIAGTRLNGTGMPESLTFQVAANQTVYLVIDGENVSRGDFELEVSW